MSSSENQGRKNDTSTLAMMSNWLGGVIVERHYGTWTLMFELQKG